MTAPEITWQAMRRARLVKLLVLAYEEQPDAAWPRLVRVAIQHNGRMVPRPTAREFNDVRDVTVGEIFGAVPAPASNGT